MLQVFALCLPQLKHVLGFVSLLTHNYYTLHYTLYFPHVISVSTSYSSKGLLIFSSFSPHYFLKDTLLVSYSYQVYIVVNTVLYLYTLPIDYLLTLFSSLCFSCNLSQTQDYNILNVCHIPSNIYTLFTLLAWITLHSNYPSIQGPDPIFLINSMKFQITSSVMPNNPEYIQQQIIIRLPVPYLRIQSIMYCFPQSNY